MTSQRSSPRGPESIDIGALRPPFATEDAATSWLFRLQRLGIRPGLDAINELLDGLGRPDRHCPSIAIAGTNGKGSAAIALAAFCRAAGLRTGLYTSPHLLSVRERIQIDGKAIAAQDLFGLVASNRARIEAVRTTFFESLTAMALAYFQQQEVDVVILETGLGGRLDATNAARKDAVVLTSIGLDHEDLLGRSRESIAREKLGLATAGVPFYLNDLGDPELDALARVTIERAGADRVLLPELTRQLTSEVDLVGLAAEGTLQRQAVRSMLAVYRDLAQRLGWPSTDPALAAAGLRLPGRYEVWGRSPRLVLDTAHNEDALRRTLGQWTAESDHDTRILVFGASQGKTIESVYAELVASAGTILVTAPDWYRARPAVELAEELRAAAVTSGAEARIELVGSVRDSLEVARRGVATMPAAGPAPSVLVTGSNFLVAEALDRLGVDDLLLEDRSPLWDDGIPLRQRPGGPATAVN